MANSRVVYATVAAIAIAVPAEGIRQIAYGDIAQPSLLTVCYGETHDVVPGKVYSIAECKAMLNTSMQQAVETVEKCRPGLPVHTLAAFADAVYNMGPTVACDTRRSTAARMLADGRIGELPELPPVDMPGENILAHLRDEADWIEVNRASIADEYDAIANLVDGITAVYLKAIYKLSRLS